ncbi:MAG: sigma-70 family RNA polymerase sigma factor [Eubacteriales bacterium]|nr:sigma-70 family RNA polymerase sigma factor [Eubacteriales bacterium]
MKPLNEQQRKLVEDNVQLVYAVLSRNFPQGIPCIGEREDVAQIGMLGLMWAATSYNPEMGAFSTYAWRGILYQLMSARSNSLRMRRHTNREPVSLQTPLEWGQNVTKVTLEDAIEDRGQDVEREALESCLGMERLVQEYGARHGREQDAEWMIRNARGETVASIARSAGVSRQAVDNRVKKFAKRMRDFYTIIIEEKDWAAK